MHCCVHACWYIYNLYAQKRCAICDHGVAPLSSTQDVKNKDADVAHLKTELADTARVSEYDFSDAIP